MAQQHCHVGGFGVWCVSYFHIPIYVSARLHFELNFL